jgi:predicted homoserine dehydrogenase-like protein
VGHLLDGLGGYDSYGVAETAAMTAEQRLLPMGVAEGCRLLRAVREDDVLTYDHVALPAGRLVDDLRDQQARHFGPAHRTPTGSS